MDKMTALACFAALFVAYMVLCAVLVLLRRRRERAAALETYRSGAQKLPPAAEYAPSGAGWERVGRYEIRYAEGDPMLVLPVQAQRALVAGAQLSVTANSSEAAKTVVDTLGKRRPAPSGGKDRR